MALLQWKCCKDGEDKILFGFALDPDCENKNCTLIFLLERKTGPANLTPPRHWITKGAAQYDQTESTNRVTLGKLWYTIDPEANQQPDNYYKLADGWFWRVKNWSTSTWRKLDHLGSKEGNVLMLVPPTLADPRLNPKLVCGLRFVDLDLLRPGFFSRYSCYPPSAKLIPSLFHLDVVLYWGHAWVTFWGRPPRWKHKSLGLTSSSCALNNSISDCKKWWLASQILLFLSSSFVF